MEKEFKLTDLFEVSTTTGFDKNKLPLNRNGKYDFVGRSKTDWGVQGCLPKLDSAPNPKNSFSLIQVGESVALWREREWYASQNIFLLNPLFEQIGQTRLYFQTVINREMSVYGSAYTSYPTMKSLRATTLSLPVVPFADPSHVYTPADIDWGYMERCIAELEEERIAELEEERVAELAAYLEAAGLDDCELTPQDEQALAEEPPFAEFRVGDVFGKALHSKYHNPKDLVLDAEGYPYICASNANNGINKDLPRVNGDGLVLTPKKIIAWGKQCPMFCIHSEACVTSQGMYFLDMTAYSDRVCLYICSALDKACGGKFDYSNCLIGRVMDEQVISLPVVPSAGPAHVYTPADIDWGYMERYIRATEKLVMADVVAYKDRVIAETRRIVHAPDSRATPAVDLPVAPCSL